MKQKSQIDPGIEQKIIDAALIEFHNRGTHGARMQHIADLAGVSKSMLHYYFVNKETLFDRVFELTLNRIFPKINRILASDLPLMQKIPVFMNTYTDILFEHYQSSAFILGELANNSDRVLELMVTGAGFEIKKLDQQVKQEADAGNIAPTDTRILLLNMLSLCVFPFVGLPVQLTRFQLSRVQYFELLEKRKVLITHMIISSIKNNELDKA